MTDALRSPGLSTEVRLAIAEIAGASGAWCPALAPTADRVAYVSDRSGLPRLEVTTLDQQTPPAVLSGAGEEVVSVAWSPDGEWLASLVSPGGSICAQLWAVRPDGTDRHLVAGEDPRSTVFAGGWTAAPGHYVCSIAPGDGPDADVVLVDVVSGARRTLASGGFLSVTAVAGDERTVLARRGPRGHRHIVLVDVATGVQRRVIPLGDPGGQASEDGRFAPDGRAVYLRAGLPAQPGVPRSDRPGLVRVPRGEGRLPGRGEVLIPRADADLDAYAARADGTVVCVWNADGSTEVEVRDLGDGALLRTVPLPQPVMPCCSMSADGSALLAELTGRRAPPWLWLVPLDGTGEPVPLPSTPRRPDAHLLVEP